MLISFILQPESGWEIYGPRIEDQMRIEDDYILEIHTGNNKPKSSTIVNALVPWW